MGCMTSEKANYIELHAASAFSFLEGASLPETLIDRACEVEMPAMALLDHNGLYGAARFHMRGKKMQVKAHIGADLSLAGFGSIEMGNRLVSGQDNYAAPKLPLLCLSKEGYGNLCQLISTYKIREPGKAEGAARREDLEQYAKGMVCLTGGADGPLAAAVYAGGEPAGRALVESLVLIFGRENVYVELQRHQLRSQEWLNQTCVRIATTLRLPLLATNGVRYAVQNEHEVLDIFTAIKNKRSLDSAGSLLTENANRYLRTSAQMHKLFKDLPSALANTTVLSSRLEFQLHNLGYEFPSYPTPGELSMHSYLQHCVKEGIQKRYGHTLKQSLLEKATAQAERELELIARLGFSGYFLIVMDIIHYCARNNILIQGRGSAANSVVCYALEITAVDPISMELLFERFLSENRGEWPDIDLDLPSGDKREQVIQYVYKKYGETGAAMTANVITYRGKSAAREVGKALGFEDDVINRLSSLVGHWEWKGPTDTIAHHFRQAGLDMAHPRIAKYLELTLRMQDLPRHLGQHSGGMVICQGRLNKVVPIERASMPGRTVVQWDKEDCADMGLVKVDLLGLGMMAVIKDCLELIPEHYGVHEELAQVPEDEQVYKTLQQADTVGMFQVESRAQMASLPRNKPTRFYDIVVQVAIIRPGPIVGKMMHPYMRRRQGKEAVTYPHPSLEPILERTLGVPLFQEQLLRIAMVAANFTGAEAEELRRAVGMRRSRERMRELEVKLRAGMTANDIGVAIQEQIIQSISSFALYGFPESHAASFALIAYASAYFKVHYLAGFTCAMLNNQPMGFYMPAVLVKDAQRHGLRIKPMCIQKSSWKCTLEKEADDRLSLRIGFNYAKGFRQQTGERLVAARARCGQFETLDDLVRQVPELTRRDLTQLARIGALNSVDSVSHRRDALWQVEQAGRPVGPLLNTISAAPDESCINPLQSMTTEDRLVADYTGTGITTGHHPMHYQRKALRLKQILSAKELRYIPDGNFVCTAGCVIARQRPGTASGFIFLSLEDESGISNVIIHPELYEQQRLLVTRAKFLLVEGRLQNQDHVVHVRASRLAPLSVSQADAGSHDFH